jgi:ADP-ribosyl-[dinitrogen reductase] hydrolase
MALHCVWTTDSFREAVLKCINMRGDADSVGAVAAQIAGAIYGVSAIPKNWIQCVQKWGKGAILICLFVC